MYKRYFCEMTDPLLKNWEKKTDERAKIYKQFLSRPDKNKVLKQLPGLHEEAFSKINCLDCAACCKNYSPRFKTPDIKRISKHLGMKEGAFIDQYLDLDNEGDYVVKTKPCPFLGNDNYCSIMTSPADVDVSYPEDESLTPARTQKGGFCRSLFVLEKLLQIKIMFPKFSHNSLIYFCN